MTRKRIRPRTTAGKLLRPMAPRDLAKGCAVLGLERPFDIACAFDVSQRAVEYWLNEESPRNVPPSIAALVRLAVAGRIKLDELADNLIE